MGFEYQINFSLKLTWHGDGILVGLISFLIGPRPLIRALIGGAQPLIVGGPLLYSAK